MKIRTEGQGGFNLIEIMIVLGLLAVLLVVAVPNFVRTRMTVQKSACIENLHQIDQAVQQWALEQKKNPNTKVTYEEISAYLKNSMVCPSGGKTFSDSYQLTTVSTLPSCQRNPMSHLLQGFPIIVTRDRAKPSGDPNATNSGPRSPNDPGSHGRGQ